MSDLLRLVSDTAAVRSILGLTFIGPSGNNSPVCKLIQHLRQSRINRR